MAIRDKALSTEDNQGLEDLLEAADRVFNNDIAGAERVVNSGSSAFGKLGQGLVILLKTSLGFEGLWAKHATQVLVDADTIAGSKSQNSLASLEDRGSAIFRPGSAYTLCQAQAQLSAAVVAILNQRMLEYMRGLYKVRQSYMGLRKLAEEERSRVKQEKASVKSKSKSSRSQTGPMSGATNDSSATPPSTLVNIGKAEGKVSSVKQHSAFLHSPSPEEADELYDIRTPHMELTSDEYTYTGTYLCFGVMLVVLGMIPSGFQYVLRVIGFKGHKERGMAMLWETTKFQNAHGALAALLLFSMYNIVRAACDITDGAGYPKKRCEALLEEMSSRYPQSVFWVLERGRMAASQKNLDRALQILSEPLHEPPKQLSELILIESTMYHMASHDYAECAEGFIRYTGQTKYSHAMFYYNAGCAQVELYRALTHTNPSQAQIHKQNALEYFNMTTVGVDKKKLMATELPFDTFVGRKLSKWRAKAEKFRVDLVDAVGPSPIEEMIYYHGLHKWMSDAQLEQSLQAIMRSKTSTIWEKEAIDERSIYALLKGVVFRNQGKFGEAKQQFMQVIAQDRAQFGGKLSDNWVQPSAHYEMAIIAWHEREFDGNDKMSKLNECAAQLDKVSRWGTYELDARLVVRVKIAQDVVNAARTADK